MGDNRPLSERKPARVRPQSIAECGSADDARSRSGAPGPNRAGNAHSAPETAIARLNSLPREELVQSWVRTCHRPPPKGISRRLLELSAAYALQAKSLGGLKPSLRRALTAAHDPRAAGSKPKAPGAPLKAGTQLVRVWNGRTHHVDVIEGGFVWNDRKFRSLSAIALEITGARWSGPRFFGL
jgi:hypothetical protein